MSQENGQPAVADSTRIKQVEITVPIVSVPDVGYTLVHLQVQLDSRQGETLKRLRMALDESKAQLASGRYVASNADAVRYLLEQVAK